ncbi:4Fe-4S binding protein [Litorisediminicola beolgyonensis]|uniref:4Fe-4S binding protein n=1 Tax=Litorisediminicola beolgyonensis TaxID=1173614 RepID=A0ABW3ZGJ4_9RHOB
MMRVFWAILFCLISASVSLAETLDRDGLAGLIAPPMSLGDPVTDQGVYQLLNSGGAEAGYVFQTEPMAPLPGFSGQAINILVVLDLEGRFLDVRLIDHNEPIFVSGLGQAPFHAFFEQYRGHSISESLVVGSPYGAGEGGGDLVYLDGVTKATASVRIAHESILAATLQVAREKMRGLDAGPPAAPDPDFAEALDWDALVAEGIAGHLRVSNAELQEEFAGTLWEYDDAEALDAPEAPYLDLWVIDVGPPSVAAAVFDAATTERLARFREISGSDEPLLMIETARHGLVSPEFVRNTAPEWVALEQDGLPVALRDADLLVGLSESLPPELRDGTAMVFRTDRRLGFDPSRPWTLSVRAVREHGMFQPETGAVTFALDHQTPERFFLKPRAAAARLSPFEEAIRNRQGDLILLAAGLGVLLPVLLFAQSRLAGLRSFTPIRLGVLALTLGFIGWWGQGQLSIVTPLAVVQAGLSGGSFAFLLYDPFSLLVWAAALVGLVLWGRGFFCGWLCPFGALQEFAHHLGRLLRLPQIELPSRWDRRLKWLKYGVLAALVWVAVANPAQIDTAAEVEPFKTAITTFFLREWHYALYALAWVFLGLVLFKGFCRYVCPLGALLAIAGVLRLRRWIPRRTECGTPCQLCRVECLYGAIEKSGKVDYSECFQCLDCVSIHDDKSRCVPLVLKDRSAKRPPRVTGHPNAVPAE